MSVIPGRNYKYSLAASWKQVKLTETKQGTKETNLKYKKIKQRFRV